MSLFVRLWIVATLTAFASAAAGVVTLMVISTQARVDQENRAALALSRMVAFTVSMEPLERLSGKAASDLLLQRARGLMAMGPLLFVTVVEADQRPVADLASPGLEEESVLNAVPDLLRTVSRTGIRQIERRDDVIYAALPLVDRAEHRRGVFAVGMPARVLKRDRSDVAAFTVAAAAIAAVLGLVAAAILTRQVAWPVRRLAELSGRLEDASFDTSGVDALVGRGDEIGRLARVMLRLVRALDHLGQRMDAEGDRGAAAPRRVSS